MTSRAAVIAIGLVVTMATSFPVAARQSSGERATTAAPTAPAVQQGRGGGPVKSPEVGADRRVTFRLRAPNAKEVAVAMSGNQRLAMQKDEQGVWTAISEPLTPEIYTYSFSVDGATITDPANREFQTSFGSQQSMFSVPGTAAWLPAAGVPRGAITRHPYHSAVANDDRDFFVYTPAGYDPRRAQPYPVLYLLHGLGDDAQRWLTGGGQAANIFDNLNAQGKAVPMVVVSPLGYGTSSGPAGGRGPENILGYEKILLSEVVPAVEKAYNVGRNREQRAIAGLSMGGAEALYVGLNHLDRFAWIGAFSSAVLLAPGVVLQPAPPTAAPAGADAAGAARGARGGSAPQLLDASTLSKAFPNLDAKANSQIRMLWIVCGTADGLIGQNRQLKDWLKSKNVQFTEQEVPDMAHVWPLWRQNVTDLAQKLFKNKE